MPLEACLPLTDLGGPAVPRDRKGQGERLVWVSGRAARVGLQTECCPEGPRLTRAGSSGQRMPSLPGDRSHSLDLQVSLQSDLQVHGLLVELGFPEQPGWVQAGLLLEMGLGGQLALGPARTAPEGC